jgi:hypothetical protein
METGIAPEIVRNVFILLKFNSLAICSVQ